MRTSTLQRRGPAEDAEDNRDARQLAHRIGSLGLLTSDVLRDALANSGSGSAAEFLAELERSGLLTPFQADKLRRGDLNGYFLGGNRLLYKVASGSFGRLFRAEDPRTGSPVAIKVLRRRWAEDPMTVTLFEREGKLGMSLHHPNVVETLDVGHDGPTGQHYLVMEFVEGGNLRDLLAVRGKLEPAEALRLLDDLAAGLAYAHGCGVTHGDIKPSNILFSSRGRAKLADFGLGRAWRTEGEGDGGVKRTVEYALLERSSGTEAGDPRSDIYFLGRVFCEMLTGQRSAEPTGGAYAFARGGASGLPAPVLPADAPSAVRQLAEVMTATDPAKRHQTAAQLWQAVRETRARVEGTGPAAAPTIYLVEQKPQMQQLIAGKLRKYGYRVLLAADPERAIERYAKQQFDGLIVDADGIGEEGLSALRRILGKAALAGSRCAAVLLLRRDQGELARRVVNDPSLAGKLTVLRRPLKLGEVTDCVRKLVPVAPQPAH